VRAAPETGSAKSETKMTQRPSWRIGFLTLVLVAPCLPARADQSKGKPEDLAGIQKAAEAFVEAFHKGDAKAAAAFWTTDGELTDISGRKLKGRDAIEQGFRQLFSENKNLKVHIEGQSLRFVTPDVAIEEGLSEVFGPDGGPPSRAHYTNVLVKKDGKWLLSSCKEAPYTPAGNYEHLRGLDWAVGDWAGRTETGDEERISLDWAANQNFLVGSFATTAKEVPVSAATQWIGWDPTAKHVRSWVFDESGAFGEGSWSANGDRWTAKMTLVLPDGKKAAATIHLSRVDADAISLRSTDRSVDGKSLPDTKEVKLSRVKN
jgi:uncharacterized protein (TIGR02246 family)